MDINLESDIIKREQIGSVIVIFVQRTKKTFSIMICRGNEMKLVGTWGSRKYASTKFSTVTASAKIVHDIMDKRPQVIIRKAKDQEPQTAVR